jgi:hypothetical protein
VALANHLSQGLIGIVPDSLRERGNNAVSPRGWPDLLVNLELAYYLTIIAMVLNVLNVYLAYTLTRVTGGAPKAWYVIIGAFALLFARNVFQLYVDININIRNYALGVEHETISVAVQILFSIGLYMLLQTFQRQLKVRQNEPVSSSN